MQGEIIRNEKNQKEKMLYSNGDLKKLIIPLIIEQTLAIAVGMADTIMVSAAGEAAVSGVSLVDTVNILLINVFPRWLRAALWSPDIIWDRSIRRRPARSPGRF